MRSSTSLFHDKLKVIERLSYLLVLTPFLVDYLSDGRILEDRRHIITETVATALCLAFSFILRLTRREVARLNHLRQTLTEAIVHDLKNPLTSIMSSVSFLLESEDPDPGKRRTLLELALRGCRAELQLIETLLEVDKLEMSVLTPRRERLAIHELVESCFADVAGAADFAGLTLRRKIEDPIPDLFADRDLLSRVFINLLNNSIKYCMAGGEICIAARYSPVEQLFHFEVTDNGIGIAKEHLGRLFDKFYRVEGDDQSRRRGSGLGLYFCRLAVEAHGGKIRVESAVGHGTTVFLDIPQPIIVEPAPRPGIIRRIHASNKEEPEQIGVVAAKK